MMLDTQPVRSSLQVAPLAITKSCSGSVSEDDATLNPSTSIYSHSQITPPSTPNESQEDLSQSPQPPRPVFHNYLRAFYPFQPACTVTDSTITLPLNEGDVVLVHSIHTNGWADGTLLATGARGWLPTNYCEGYDPEEMRNLLKALLNFWDLLRSTVTEDQDIFENQEFMKGIIAGVRYLLERTHCLTRETPTIQRSDSLRRGRKSLLSELSLLVKTAKRLQGMLRFSAHFTDDANDVIDEMILRAFKVVVRGVRFLDLLEEDRRTRAPAVTVMATVMEESFVPPTPPAETTSFGQGVEEGNSAKCRTNTDEMATESSAEATRASESTPQRLSCIQSPATVLGNQMSQRNQQAPNRLSASITHRVSFAGRPTSAQPHNLVSEQLNSCHDAFLSHLSSLIGRLRLQSLSRSEFALAIRLSTTSGGALWAVVNVVCDHNTLVPESLETARATMFDHIRDLVSSARDILKSCDIEAEHIVMPQDDALQNAAIHCVKTAGECVARTKWVLEKIGDFEFTIQVADLGLDLSLFELASQSRPRTPEKTSVVDPKKSPTSPVPSSLLLSMDKPLPEIPPTASMVEAVGPTEVSLSSRSQSVTVDASPSTSVSSVPLSRPLVQPLPKLSTALISEGSYSPTEVSHDVELLHGSFRSDTGTATSSGTISSYLSRDFESSVVSQTSTRATTPDSAQAPRNQPSLSDISTTGSTALTEEVEEVESRLLEKTFVHELMFNKDGQVVGGSLPALVERLTTHETTPDAMFVSAFYLTFRLFCTPTRLVEVLIERFDYIGEYPAIANPVQLRVYNVLKGWLESHWREPTDGEALPLIAHFAEYKLGLIIPSAGERLTQLVQRVSSTENLTLSRLASSIGKPNTSASADVTLPASVLSKGQQGLLSNWKIGGSSPSILDFDSLELARQITLKQMSIFCSIKPEELLGSQWMKHGGVDSPNVKAMSGFSNDLSNLVADTILQHSEVKKRAAMIKQWIKIANQCLELNNYDGLMAIVCSLNSSVISRLRKTWDIISPKRRELFRALQAIVEPANNHRVLRARLQGHVPPCLPFLGMFLTDLTFVDIGNPATKQHPGVGLQGQGMTVINFDKHSRTAKIITDLQRFQLPYRMTELLDMQEWLQAQIVRMKELDQSNVQVSYYRKSLLLEPRETALRTPVEGPTPTTQAGAKADLFGWISRDRHNNHTAVAI
ncbi:ras guanine nucleotide exchange factor domain-containing protein [Ustulina deusta]|nr:ras guanine nucleotide exchange factor domain-containing protein [Ustulina deusta]